MTMVNYLPFNPILQCQVERIEYSFQRCSGSLYMPANQCCDMQGCIDLFQRIDPHVIWISTYAGETEDTSYEYDDDGQWNAILPPRNKAA